MSKRRINKQQSTRIERQHQHLRDKQVTDDTLSEGLVITRYAKYALVEDASAALIRCSIRPSVESLVAGDHVVWQEESPGLGSIVSLYPRKTILGRPDKHGHYKAIAANITQVMIVIAPLPEVSWELLDSYLVMADYLKLSPFILVNKTDMECDEIRHQLMQVYEPLGYPILFTSKNNKNSTNLFKALDNHVSVFVGQSGVGKSSLISRLLPHEAKNIRTQAISESSNLGCHTTSNSKVYHMPTGGSLIDSPGVREFGLWQMPRADIAKGYREFKPYLSQCKFRNCSHFDTPGCAIIHAVKNKVISNKRYENYVKMFHTQEST